MLVQAFIYYHDLEETMAKKNNLLSTTFGTQFRLYTTVGKTVREAGSYMRKKKK